MFLPAKKTPPFIIPAGFDVGQLVFVPRYGMPVIHDRKTVDAAGLSFDAFELVFYNPDYVVSTSARTKPSMTVPVERAAAKFFPLPSEADLEKILEKTRLAARPATGAWHGVKERHETDLASGDWNLIAKVFVRTKPVNAESSMSFSQLDFYNEALHTLAIAYSIVHGTNVSEARTVFENGLKPSAARVLKIVKPETAAATVSEVQKIPPALASSDLPLKVVFNMRGMIADEWHQILARNPQAATLQQAFMLVEDAGWPGISASVYGINNDQAEILRGQVTGAMAKLATMIK